MNQAKSIQLFFVFSSFLLASCGKKGSDIKPTEVLTSNLKTTINEFNLKKDFRGVRKGSGNSKEDKFLRGWQHWDTDRFQNVHIPSSNIQLAKKVLQSEQTHEVVVAVIDSGIDINHPAFKGRLWSNPHEIPHDGIDNDGNGYIDDIHGWNFLGGVTNENLEITRKYRRCQAHSLFSSEDSHDCYSIQKKFTKKNTKAQKEWDYINENSWRFDAETVAHYYNNFHYSLNPSFNPRESSISNTFYDEQWGDSNVLPKEEDEMHGTHVAGIIAGRSLNGISIGVNSKAKIMSLRVVPEGDERAKDVARAVLYAAHNGAKIINMSFGNYENTNQEELLKAFEFAADKGVLIVHAAGNDALNTNDLTHSPSRKGGSQKLMDSWLEVGSSTSTVYYNKEKEGFFANLKRLPSSFSNFGTTSVDLFAPGHQIYAPIPGEKYASLSGTSMASPLVAGVASLLLSHNPELTAHELKEILMATAREESLYVYRPDERRPYESSEIHFSDLSRSGSVLDAYQALEYSIKYY